MKLRNIITEEICDAIYQRAISIRRRKRNLHHRRTLRRGRMSPLDDIEIKEVGYAPIDEVVMLRNEIAFLKGKVEVYEKFLKDRGFIKEKK